MPLCDHLEQILLAEPHGNVLNHHSRQRFNAVEDAVEIDRVARQLLLHIVLRWWHREAALNHVYGAVARAGVHGEHAKGMLSLHFEGRCGELQR